MALVETPMFNGAMVDFFRKESFQELARPSSINSGSMTAHQRPNTWRREVKRELNLLQTVK
jgi:hypothetical protein